MRLIGAILIVVCGTLFGALKASNLATRTKQLESLRAFLLNLTLKMSASGEELPNILCKLNENGVTLKNGEWSGLSQLKKDEMQIAKSFSENLGKSDILGQKQNARLHTELLDEKIKLARSQQRSASKLYVSLGFFISLCVAVVLL